MLLQRLSPAILGMLCFAGAIADAAQPRINQLAPQGVRRGAEVTVKLLGPRVGAEPQEILFDAPGLSVVKLEPTDGNTLQATLKVAEDSPLGRHAIRLRTATGVSNLVTLHVGALESVDEVEPNSTIAEAQAIPLGRTVHGVIKVEDDDYFAVELEEGQRLSVEVEGIRLGRTFFDPCLELLDAAGKTVAASDDDAAAYQDAFLSYIAPAAGRYLVRLRESAYQGNDASTYLLHIGDFPRPAAAYPPAVVAGQASEVTLIGDPKGDFTQTVTALGELKGDYELHAADDAGVAPSSLPMKVVAAPPVLEAEPNNDRKEPTRMTTPGAAAGVIGAEGDRDHFVITMKKGEVLDLRVRARELRSGLDPVLRVFDAKGKRLAGADDEGRFPDSYIRFTAPDDGDYTLQIEDRTRRGDPSFVYLVDATPRVAAVEITLDERQRFEATTIEVPQGGRCAVLLTVNRKDVGGEMQVAFDSLPPGITAECSPLPADYNQLPVVFSAASEAPLAGTLTSVTASFTQPENQPPLETRFRQQTWMVRGRNNVSVWSHYANHAAVAVTKRLPFTITVDQPQAPLVRDGNMVLRVHARRDEGFDQAIRVYTLHHTPGVSTNRSLSIPQGQNDVDIPVTANGQARTGAWPTVVVADTGVDGRVFASSPFVTLNVAEAYFDLSVPTVTTKQGEPVEMTVALSHRTPFEGNATLELVGLPPGVTADPVEVAAGAESAKFAIDVPLDARIGPNPGVGVRVRLMVKGEQVEYRHGYAEFRIDPAPTKTAKQTASAGGQKS
ncbi:pre-peptidase C-terminal domain-containing protein [Botrimarina mediterranea]|uniref:COG1470 family protein n=1 Tax=Botrimarina mediterranea TaxID=2528022 RepID=UPI00118A47D6|nr:putative subtilase-type serine protease precursor [Planctomycetes bacterium K2D]